MRAVTVGKRIIRQILADKRTIGLMFVAPVFITFLVYTILTSATTEPVIGVVSAPDPFVQVLEEKTKVVAFESEEKARVALQTGDARAYAAFDGAASKIMLEGSEPTVNKLVLAILHISFLETAAKNPSVTFAEPKINYLYGSADYSSFDAMAPLVMGFLIFFFVFVVSGISFLRERMTGTLERILATPLHRGEIVMGYFIGFGLFVTIQTLIVQFFIVYGLDVPVAGSIWLVLLLNLLLATMALSLGTFLSSFARNEFQLFQFIPLVITPQILFSGMFDLSAAPGWVAALAKVFPLTYGAEALKDVMIRGLGFASIKTEVLILLGYVLAFLVLNTLALKKYRKI